MNKQKFSKREIDCLSLLNMNMTQKEIAERMGLSQRTVEQYLRIIRFKTKIKKRSELTRFFRENLLPQKKELGESDE